MSETTQVRIMKWKYTALQERGKPFKRSGAAELDYILDKILGDSSTDNSSGKS